ncbi:hypothetical protein MNEG_15826, partial [Monoraphidium neglectum]
AADSHGAPGGNADPSRGARAADQEAAADGADGAGPLLCTPQSAAAAADDACAVAGACGAAGASP